MKQIKTKLQMLPLGLVLISVKVTRNSLQFIKCLSSTEHTNILLSTDIE